MLAVEAELQGERASALGEAGRKIERGLATLEASQSARPDVRQEAIDELAYAVWNYIIIREGVGMYDHDQALAVYGVPRYVMARVGVMKPLDRPLR